jgi:Phosphotransferase enzyme family
MLAARATRIDIDDAAKFLIERGLITTRSVIMGDLTVTSVVRRNRNLRIERHDGPGYLIKQPDDPASSSQYSLSLEAAFYSLCRQAPGSPLNRFLPTMSHFDPDTATLALELLTETQSLSDYYNRLAWPDLPIDSVKLIGEIIGTLHATFCNPTLQTDGRLHWLNRGIPWIMQAHKPTLDFLTTLSAANYQTLTILQTDGAINAAMHRLSSLWDSSTVIHSDIKFDNFRISGDDDRPPRGYLVDWEMVQFGDAAWDIGGILQEFLTLWMKKIQENLSPDEFLGKTPHRHFNALHPLFRSLWISYCQANPLPNATLTALLRKSIIYAAVRLIQSAFEIAMTAPALPLLSVLLLQLSSYLLADTASSQMQIFGLYENDI